MKGVVEFLDPCAGEGDAVLALMEAMMPGKHGNSHVHTVEMERRRFEALTTNVRERAGWRSHPLQGDAFRVAYKISRGIQVLFANPPYDTDHQFKRLEHRFLSRFTGTLMEDGALFFVVPFYALKASADLLAQEYSRLYCFRFPEPDWDAYKQVVLVGRKGPTQMTPDAGLRDQVLGWANDADSIPVLTDNPRPLWTLPDDTVNYSRDAFTTWEMRPVDTATMMAELKPWTMSDRSGKQFPIYGVIPEVGELIARTYPTAMPPRPAHIAAGIAAGVFNGARIVPNDPASKLPPLLVKGVFDKEFRTVDEKTNKDGEVTGLVQIQQPKLVVSVLDLNQCCYHTMKMEAATSKATEISEFTTGDLLAHYSRSLLDTLLDHCPVQHDPSNPDHRMALPFTIMGEVTPLDPTATRVIPRLLFPAQAHCVMSAIKLLGGLKAKKRGRIGKTALVLGELGSGKSTISLATAHSIGAKRILILCPPHLLDSWQTQIAAVTPWAKATVLKDIPSIEAFSADASTPVAIAILSRETAKLGHAIEGVTGWCPKCGSELPEEDLAKKRSRCEATHRMPLNEEAQIMLDLGRLLMARFPGDSRTNALAMTRHMRKVIQAWEALPRTGAMETKAEMDLRSSPRLTGAIWSLAGMFCKSARNQYGNQDNKHLQALQLLLAGLNDQDLIAQVALYLYTFQSTSPEEDSTSQQRQCGEAVRTAARGLLLLMAPGSAKLLEMVSEFKAVKLEEQESSTYSYGRPQDPWKEWAIIQDALCNKTEYLNWYSYHGMAFSESGVMLRDRSVGDSRSFLDAISQLSPAASWATSEVCGEVLFQAIPEPRRVPLAKHIAKKYPKLFDMLFIDENQDFSSAGSAQYFASSALASLGLPTLRLTGSVMNGYAESLFNTLWESSPAFREEFARDQRTLFTDRYGYKKRILEQKDMDTGKPVAYGAVTDRIEERGRDVGHAPGVLPLLILKHLLPIAVTLHKTDLALNLPVCREIVEKIQPTSEQLARHESMLADLLAAIKADRFDEVLSGKLFGQLSEAPSHLDRCTDDVGNCDDGAFEIRYPESVGGSLVHRAEPFSSTTLLPKEEWMLNKVEAELAEGRNVMVFSWHVSLLPRLARLIEARIGEKVVVLNPAKVGTAKREAWINKEVVGKGRRVMLTNPVAIMTGLNNLVWFATEVFFEGPNCAAIVARQAIGRVDRIGQTKETRIYFPLYEVDTQVGMHELLMTKVAVSMSVDGLDPEGALAAAGASEGSAYTGISVGKHLYDLLSERAARVRPVSGFSSPKASLGGVLDLLGS